MKNQIQVDVHPAQQGFLNSQALYRGFVGGRGCGKSFIGALDVVLRAQPGRLYGVYAPTFPMMRDATLRSFMATARRLNYLRDFKRGDIIITLGNGAEVMFRSLDDPERARGPNISGAWMDEASLVPRSAFDIIIASLREGGEQGWLSSTFTPKGKSHWTYEVFGTDRPNVDLFHAKTGDNPFLPPEFAETLREQYPAQFAAQELDGAFVDLSGGVFQREWFAVVENAPDGLKWHRYWDLAASMKQSADYLASCAVAMAGDGRVYIRDMIRGRWEWPDQERILVQTMLVEPRVIHGIEKALHGIAALQALQRRRELAGITVQGIDVDRDKLSRALPLASRAEQGKVSLVRGNWIPDFLDELSAFSGDGSTHDDQVDAASGALQMIASGRGRKLVTW